MLKAVGLRMAKIMFCVGTALISFCFNASAATEQQRLTTNPPQPAGFFGVSVTASGSMAAAGSIGAISPEGVMAGGVFLFERTVGAWEPRGAIFASDGAPGDRFGGYVAMDGDTLAVAANLADGFGANTGAVYIFRRQGTEWLEEAKLWPPDGVSSDANSPIIHVAVSGDTLAVGWPSDDGAALNAGCVYVYTRNGTEWTQQTKIVESTPVVNRGFGSVALRGDTLVIGGVNLLTALEVRGAANVYTRTAGVWALSHTLTGDEGFDWGFGHAVALRDDVAAVASPNRFGPSGQVYVFRRQGAAWVRERRINTSYVYGDGLAVGDGRVAHGNAQGGSGDGVVAVYQYVNGVWATEDVLRSAAHDYGAQFGTTITFTGDHVLAGASRGRPEGVINAGAAYSFSLDTAPPSVSSVAHLLGLSEPGLVRFTVTFTEPVTGVDVSDFAIDADGPSGGSVVSVEGSGADYTVVIETGSGTGTVTLTLVDDDSILDDGGNALGGAGTGNGTYSAGTVVDIVAELPAADAKALMFLGLCLMTLAAIAMVRAMGRQP